MKKILVFGLSDYYGGTESFFLNYLKFNRNKNLSFDFIPENCELAQKNEFEKLGCKVYIISNWRKKYFLYKRELKEIIKNNHYDAIYVNFLSAYNIYPLVLAKKFNIKVRICHSHNSSSPKNIIKLIIHQINKRRISKYATNKLACSHKAASWMYTKNDYKVVPNAVDAHKFYFNKLIREKKRKELNIDEDTLVLGFVGRLSYQKNPIFLIKILRLILEKNKNTKLLIVGDGNLKSKLIKQIEVYHLNENVIMLGNRNDVHELMQAFDVFVLPSRFEGLGIVLIEAQFCGLKCFTSEFIPEEADISKTVEFLRLSDRGKAWKDSILNSEINEENRLKIIKRCDCKFDLNSTYNVFFDYIDKLIQ